MNNIYVIDGSLTDIEAILQQLSEGADYVLVDRQQDGILQLRNYLQNFQTGTISSLHIVSHGSDGQFALGSGIINRETINRYKNDLAVIGKYLTDSADVLLYGCDIARTDAGKAFVQSLAAAIGADVAASDDITAAPPAPETSDTPPETSNTPPETSAQPPALPPIPPPPAPEAEPQEQDAEENGDSELEYEVGSVEETIHTPIVAVSAPLQMQPSEPDTVTDPPQPPEPDTTTTPPTDPYGHAGYEIADTASYAFGMFGGSANGIVTLGGIYSGRFENYSDAHNYIITPHFRGFAHIVNKYYDPDKGGHIYFEKGVQIVGIDDFTAGSVTLANGGIVVFSFADELHFHSGGEEAMSYDDFYTAVRTATDGGGTYTVGSYISASDIEYQTSARATAKYVGGAENNLFTFGFSRPIDADGGDGTDIYRLSRFQTESARISDRSDNDLVIFEYGVQVIKVLGGVSDFEFTYIGGDESTPTAKTLTVEAARSKTYQIGNNTDLRFTALDFSQAFTNPGLPIDLALAPEIRRQWLDSDNLATIPAGTGVIANLSTTGYFEEGVEIAPAGKAIFYNSGGVLKDENGIAYSLDIGTNAFSDSRNDNNIYGSEGDDLIVANGNDNYLNGGGGKDRFVFSGFIADNTMRDFESGTDTILINSDMNFSVDRNRYVTITNDQNKVFGYISFFGGQVMASDIVKTVEADDTAETTYNIYSYDGEGDYTIRDNTIIHQGSPDRTFDDAASLFFTNRGSDSRIILEDVDAKITGITSSGTKETLDLSAIFSNMQFNPGAESVKIGDDYTLGVFNLYGYIGGGKDDIFIPDTGGLDNLFDGKGADTQDGDQIIYGAFTGTATITDDNEWQLSSATYGTDTIIDIEDFAFTGAVNMTLAANDEGFSDAVIMQLSSFDDKVTLQSLYDDVQINAGNGDDSIIFTFDDILTISTDTITSGSHTLQYSGVETISVHEDSDILFDDLNLPTLMNVVTIGIGDGLVSATITLTESDTPDTITDGTHTITFAEGVAVAREGGKNDDTFYVFRQGGVSGGEGKDTIISDKIHGSNHLGGGGAEDSITYTDLGATVNLSFPTGISSYTGLPFPNGINTGDGQDALSEIETVNINGHDGGSTLNFSTFNLDIAPYISHINMVGGAGHLANFTSVSVDLTIDVGEQKFSYGDNTVGLVGFTDFTGGTGDNRFIDGTTSGDNVYIGNSGTDTLEYKGSDNINGTIGIVDGEIVFSDSNYGNDAFSNIETVTVASDSTNDDTLLITNDMDGLTFDSGGGKDDLTIGIGADNFVVRGGNDDDKFSVADTALGGELYGDSGNDTFTVNNQAGQISAYGGDDEDQFIIGEKIATGKFYGDGGDDTFTINASTTLQSLEIDGGADSDNILLQNNFMVQDGGNINGKITFSNIETLTTSFELSILTLQGVATAEDTAPTVTLQGQAGQTVTASTGNVDFTITASGSPTATVNGYHYILNGFDIFRGGDDNTNFHLSQRQGITLIGGSGADNFIITGDDVTQTINNFNNGQDTIDFTSADASIFDLEITSDSGMTTIVVAHLGTEIEVVGDFSADDNLLISRTKIMNTWTVNNTYREFAGRETSIDTLDFDTNFGDYGVGAEDYIYANLSDSKVTVDYFGSSLEISATVASVRGVGQIAPFSVVRLDNVIGSGGSDVLIGNDGANRLDGGRGGDDIFYGGKGDDVFVVVPAGGAGDFIGDFGIGGIAGSLGRDRIDLSGLATPVSTNFIVRAANSMTAAYATSDIVIETSDSSFGFELVLDSAGKAAVQNSGLDIDIYVENYLKNNSDIFIGYDVYGTPKTDRETHNIGTEFQWKNSDADLIFGTDKYDILNYNNGQYDNKETAVAINLSTTDVHAGTFVDSINLGRFQQMNLQLSGNTRYESFPGNGNESLYSGKIYSVDGIYGSKGDDIFYGSDAGEVLDGKDGNNSIFGNGGNDIISVTAGGINLLHGGDGDDTISGGTGNDIIVAGGGSDTLSGGGGDDNFIIFADKTALGTNTIGDFDVSDRIFVIIDKALQSDVISMAAVTGAVEFSIEGNMVGKIEFTNQQDVTNFLPRIAIVHVDDATLPNQIREPLRFSIEFDSSVTGAWELNNEPADRQLTIADGQRFYLVWNDSNGGDGVDTLAELSQAYSDGDFSIALNGGNLELTFADNKIITIDGAGDYADTADDNFDAFIDAVGGEEWILF